MIVQSESWRPQRRETAFDPQMQRLAIIAAGVLGVLVLGYGGYSLIGHAPRTVPVIEADSRPVRVRPDNPGGMQIAGAEEQILGGEGSGQADVMAPPPEVPQPQALRAQVQAARQPAPAPPPAPSPVQPVSLANPPAPPPAAISAMPEQRPAPRAPATRAALAPVASGTQVQLAAVESEAAALAEWQRLSKKMPDLLSGRQPAVMRLERDGKTLFRLRTAGFADIAAATQFCTQVKAKGAGCSIASF